MPSINRIRIINFSYNNDSRHILDETFHFHGGENALLNLANGGGKSVLVQLLLQPIMPKAKIQGRGIAGFFRKKKLPTYVMIEWKLDGNGGYLLTGIAMVSQEGVGGEEEKNRVRYFTFTSKYTGSNVFDITHIGLAERKGGLLEVLPFREAREMMGEKERKDPFTFGYFSEDDGERYGRRLGEFGVVQSEWRNVIAKINDNEGGIEEIFQKYKTSGQLLDEWIIKTVEKAMFRDRAEARRLEDMLKGLVREVAENERFIGEKQLLDSFLESFQQLGEGLSDLVKGLDGQQKLGGKLSAFYHWLLGSTASLQDKYTINDQKIKDCQREESHIDLEERSQDYYLKSAQYQTQAERLEHAERKVQETERTLGASRLQERVLQAARIIEEISRKRAELSGIEEKLAASREQYDKDGRVKSLEYTLKLLWEEARDQIVSEIADLVREKKEKEELAGRTKEELDRLDTEKSRLDREKGQLEERKKQFEKNEKDVYRKLGFELRRNLLGELEPKEMEKTRLALEEFRDHLAEEEAKLEAEKKAGVQRLDEIDRAEEKLRSFILEEKMGLQGFNRDIQEYEQKEQEIKKIIAKYSFDIGLRFDGERLQTDFKRQIKDLESRMEEAVRVRDQAAEGLSSLKNERLHIPGELADLLASFDIQFDTGEAYLRRLDTDIRQQMLEQNPILPFAFIVSQADLDRVAQFMDKITLRRIIPFVTYEDLGANVEKMGRMARIPGGINLACLYEGRMFDTESLTNLIAELEEKNREAVAQHGHFSQAHQELVSDGASCARFKFTADYLYGLEKKKKKCEQLIQDGDNQINGLKKEKGIIKNWENELTKKIGEQHTAWEKAGEKVVIFACFLVQEKDYQDCRVKLDRVSNSIVALNGRKSDLRDTGDRLQKEIFALGEKLKQRQRDGEEAQNKGDLYRNAEQAETEEGNILELEERLKVLKEQYGSDIEQWEKQKAALHQECARRQKELDLMALPQDAYRGVVYDEGAAYQLREEIKFLERELKKHQQEEKEAARKEGAAKGAFDTALFEVKKLGTERPLPQEDIRGGFEERRKRIQLQYKELGVENKNIDRSIRSNEQMMGKITQLVDPAETEPEQGFIPEQDLVNQLQRWEADYRRLAGENQQGAEKLRNIYAQLKLGFREKNLNLDNIFKGLDPLWEKAGLVFDDFYYLYERMSLHGEKLGELIRLYEVQLANLERDKRDMVQQSFLHGMMILEEIQWISDNSKVRIQGRTRPVQMLKIEMKPDDKEHAMERMKEYIDNCIRRVREETRDDKKEDEIRKTIAKQMASRELLNVYLGNTQISISVFKIELNMVHSRLKSWEEAVRENSGGEKFVVFFSVLAALMAYTRDRTLEAAGGNAESDTRVLIMDNPFGPISSEHLLKPLFEIAKRHRTQLICLSDLKQNSIMNCFNLIYMLKVRTSAIGGNEYLKFEKFIRDEREITPDEKLEKAVFRASDIKQISLFEDE